MAQRKKEKRITKAFRNAAGTISNFEINGDTRIKYQCALEKARRGELIGINLYPELVNDITREQKIRGFWDKILWFLRNNKKKLF